MVLSIVTQIAEFADQSPYKQPPFSKKTWGHPLHSLCSYQGKIKPSIAYWLIKLFTSEGDIVLDPLGGVGTIPFEASQLGRQSISNDLSPLAYTIASAKLNPPHLEDAKSFLDSFDTELTQIKLSPYDYESAEFGLNAKVKDYYHTDTLTEILKARRYFMEKKQLSQVEIFIKASLLHILHGNRPYALSRRSHPITPFHPTGEFEYRSLITRLREKVERALGEKLPTSFMIGKSFSIDFRELPSHTEKTVDCIITSPPFLGMRFDRPNWLRLWFCGWGQDDFHETSKNFLERQQIRNLEIYSEFFAMCQSLLKDNGLLIIHLGGSKKHSMVQKLTEIGCRNLKLISVIEEEVIGIESHGILDKGLTETHNFLFFLK